MEVLLKSQIISIKNLPILLIILFVVQGIIYSGMYPLWDPWDEPPHFAYLQHMIEKKTLPTTEDYLSNEIVFTFDKTPMSFFLLENWVCCNITDFKYYNLDTYWNTFDLEEAQKNKETISSQTLESRTTSEPFIVIYEAQQPPISYIVQVPVYLLFYDQDILTRVFALRIFSILVTAAAAIVAYKTISLLFDDRFIRLGSLMFIVFNPMFTNNMSRVSNEAVTILLFSVFLYLMILYLKGKTNTLHVVLIGVVLGLGLLTKATFLPAIILVPVFIFLRHIQNNSHKLRISILQSLKNLGLILGITVPMISWWYYERFATGNPTGVIDVRGISLNRFIQGIIQLEWGDYFGDFFVTFWGFFGTSLHLAPGGFFLIVMIMIGISVAGLGFGIALKVKHIGRKIFRNWKYQSIFALALSFLLIVFAQAMFNVQYFLIHGSFVPPGWYSFISITAIAVVLILGYRTIIINTKLKRFTEEFLLVAFVILIIFNASTFYWLVTKYYVAV